MIVIACSAIANSLGIKPDRRTMSVYNDIHTRLMRLNFSQEEVDQMLVSAQERVAARMKQRE